MKDVFLTNYKIYRRGDNFLISDYKGRDVFYYKIKSEWPSFPENISVNTNVFNDSLMDFCIKQLTENNLNETKMKFYLMTYFIRMLKYDFSKYFILDNSVLDKYGKLNTSLLKFYVKKYVDIYYYKDAMFTLNEPYTTNYNTRLFDLLNKEVDRKTMLDDSIAIDRSDFELELTTDLLKEAYVEEYDVNSVFYYQLNEDEDPNLKFYKDAYMMMLGNRIQMVFIR
jgi:hypothetical protein